LELILSQEMLVIKCIEVSALAFVWEFGWVADHISVSMVPAMIVVPVYSFLVVNCMHKNIILWFTVL
jgi:hypothetical protein